MSQMLLVLLSQPVEQDEANRNSILSTVAILVGIAAGLATLGGILQRYAKKKLEELIQQTNETRGQLETKNGRTVADYTEESHVTLNNICTKLDRYYEVSLESLGLARSNRESIERHLEGHPPRGG